jgi:phospholipid-binding lipoprotein MlaA
MGVARAPSEDGIDSGTVRDGMSRAATRRAKRSQERALLLAVLLASVALLPTRADAGDPPPPADQKTRGDALFDEEILAPQVPDPLEPVNRPMFAGNMALDTVIIDPIARAYGFVVPAPVKASVRGFFSNLNRPVVFANEILQLSPRRAAQTLGRFVLNSTLGIGGLFDPAAELHWDEHEADFGQTLGKLGIGPGIYIVLPFLGPSTARDTVGTFVDMFLRIDTWLLPFSSQLILGGGYGITVREDKRDELEELRRSSLDFYAAVRSAYLQSREKLVREARARRCFRD